jgi:hypothetical protein
MKTFLTEKKLLNSFATVLLLALLFSCNNNETSSVFPSVKCKCDDDCELFSFFKDCDKEIIEENGILKEHYSMYAEKDTISGLWYKVQDTLFFEDETGTYPFLFFSQKSKDSTIVHGKIGSKPTNYIILLNSVAYTSNDTIYSIVHILNPFLNVDIACSDETLKVYSFDDFSSCFYYEISSQRGIIYYKSVYSNQINRMHLMTDYKAPYLR